MPAAPATSPSATPVSYTHLIDSLIEIVGELRDITDKLTAALQELQGRLGTSDGTVSDLADELEVSNSLSTIYKTLDEVIKAMDNVPGLMNQFSVALGNYSSQQLSAYMQFTEAREKLKDYENQLEDAKQLYDCLLYTSCGLIGGVYRAHRAELFKMLFCVSVGAAALGQPAHLVDAHALGTSLCSWLTTLPSARVRMP